ncbi:MAG: hypothetical protein O2875_07040, partial [Planctomycetota bacterium]|nr:hypothetical protein [Planctomycetota bacterium]
MTQSIIIFVIILVVQAIAVGVAKKKEAQKKAELENQRLGRKSNAPATMSVERRVDRVDVQPTVPKRDLFAAAQAKAQRKSDAGIPRGTTKSSTASGDSFTSVVGSRKELETVTDLGANSKRERFSVKIEFPKSNSMSDSSQSDAPRVRANPFRMIPLHSSEGEATSAQLARTVSAIRDGMLRKDGVQAKVAMKIQPPVIGAREFS